MSNVNREVFASEPTGTPAEKYLKFQEKVKKTIYFDNLSPKVTETVLRTALEQFGAVISVGFIPNHIEFENNPRCALVEMNDAKQAKSIVEAMQTQLFMMSGMPRPVRAFAAKPEMFMDRPTEPGRKLQCMWMNPKDQDFATAKEIKNLIRKHRAEVSYVFELLLEEEKKLHKEQEECLKANYRKFQLIDNLWKDKTIHLLGHKVGLRMDE